MEQKNRTNGEHVGMVSEPTPHVRVFIPIRSKYRTKTDAELSAELSQFPSWDEIKHADLSDVDYRHYKHKKSPTTIKSISKWL